METEKEIDELDADIRELDDAEEAAKAERHKHLERYKGASGSADCGWLASQKAAGIPLPPKTGIKGFMGAARKGTDEHQLESLKVEKLNQWKPLEGIVRAHDIMVTTQITPDCIVESEIDLALVAGTVEEVEWEFKHGVEKTYQLTDGSHFVKIYDIKTKSDLAYWKAVAMARKGKFSHKWLAQFHIYMKGTSMDCLYVRIVNRDNGLSETFKINWDNRVWDWVVKHEERIEEITTQLKDSPSAEIELDTEDLLAFDPDPLDMMVDENTDPNMLQLSECWKYCELSKTYEEYDKNNRPSLILDEWCPAVHELLIKAATQKFHIGEQYCMGVSKVTIMDIDYIVLKILVQNKSGKGGQDGKGQTAVSFDGAITTFKPIESWKKSD
jgi:hypothetical protein